MANRDYTKHLVSANEPSSSNLGDEWYNPSTNELYKRLVKDGTEVSWFNIAFSSTGSTGSTGSAGFEGYADSPTAPSFTWAGDLNTGMYSPAADTIGFTTGGVSRVIIDSTGITSTGNVTAYSDERLKKDWEEVEPNFVDQLANVKSGTYTRTDSDQRQAGVSAQSLQELLPETVIAGGDGILSVAYGNAALLSAVQLAKRVVELEERIVRLEKLLFNS
jgi:hypothetical protein